MHTPVGRQPRCLGAGLMYIPFVFNRARQRPPHPLPFQAVLTRRKLPPLSDRPWDGNVSTIGSWLLEGEGADWTVVFAPDGNGSSAFCSLPRCSVKTPLYAEMVPALHPLAVLRQHLASQ